MNLRRLLTAGALIVAAALWQSCKPARSAEPPSVASEVYFTPGKSCTDAIVRELGAAKTTVHVQAYSFTSQPIARALVDADARGVKCVVLLDATNRSKNYSVADLLAHEGVETYIDSQHAIAHNKIMIIDGATVLTGSFNFTKAAEENNAENLLVLHDRRLAQEYESNWQAHLAHSEYYAGR